MTRKPWYNCGSKGYISPSEPLLTESKIGRTGSRLAQLGNGPGERILVEPKNGPGAAEIRERIFECKESVKHLLEEGKIEEALKKLREADEFLKSGSNSGDHGLFKDAMCWALKCIKKSGPGNRQELGDAWRCKAWLEAREGNHLRALKDCAAAAERYLSGGAHCTAECAKRAAVAYKEAKGAAYKLRSEPKLLKHVLESYERMEKAFTPALDSAEAEPHIQHCVKDLRHALATMEGAGKFHKFFGHL
ncbi:MAG: hypothetical protein WC488_01380 [Candidatus Micrarchaeia archaeon]